MKAISFILLASFACACSSGSGVRLGLSSSEPAASAKERLVAAISEQGCSLSTQNVALILSSAQINAEDVRQLVPVLEREGRVRVGPSGDIKLTSGTCA